MLHVIRTSGASGAENHIVVLARALRETGWHSDVLAASPDPSALDSLVRQLAEVSDDVELVRARFDVSVRLLRRIVDRLRSGRYALAHAHLVHADWHLAAGSLVAGNVPLVSSKHNPDPFRQLLLFRLVERAALRRYSAVIAISNSLRTFTEAWTGMSPVTVHYGLDAPREPPWRNAREATRLLAVGRLEKQKGFDVAVAAMPLVLRDAPQVRLDIAGDGPQRQELIEMVRSLGLDKSVRLLAHRGDVPRLMVEADVLLHPARWEGFGLVLLEAMRAALPIVATRVAAIPEIVEDGVTGILVPPDEPETLSTALLDLIRDPSAARRKGIAGYRRLRSKFSPEAMARGVSDVYESVLNPPDCRVHGSLLVGRPSP